MTNPVQVGFAAAAGKLNASQPLAVFDNITGLPAANGAPQINPGTAPTPVVAVATTLSGTVTDDSLPSGSELSSVWTVRSAPVGGQVSFADANAPTTSATFSVAGSYVLRLTASDGPATVFEELTVNVASYETFAIWISSQSGVGGLTGATDDPDGDGFDNLLEYALGTAAAASTSRPVVGSSLTSSFKLTFTPSRTTGLSYFIESSPDLGSWTATDITSLLTAGQPYEYTDPAPVTGKRFLRLKITAP